MTTPRDLFIVTLDVESSRPVERGDLSLALAGAELIDLLEAQAVTLDGEHIVPGYRPALADHLLDEAAQSLVRDTPHESVGDWLWRRGNRLSTAYRTALESEGLLTRQRRRGMPFRSVEIALVDSPARREAAHRWTSEEPVLAHLAAGLGVGSKLPEDAPDVSDDAVATVLAEVNTALVELQAERQRRAIEEAAFDNIWRGGDG
ncbi:GPP34 family phosphoprotein [Streptomyces sp. NPDC048506]|uniref:GOLPH3/VPS74 family protein n=1 Tax=Streptomyces sp. NPDC048506 TaxID=3155028 RepID=UPI00341B2CC3